MLEKKLFSTNQAHGPWGPSRLRLAMTKEDAVGAPNPMSNRETSTFLVVLTIRRKAQPFSEAKHSSAEDE